MGFNSHLMRRTWQYQVLTRFKAALPKNMANSKLINQLFENHPESFVVDLPNKIKTLNALLNEKSPYLLQHAHNPVNWCPWREEAFTRAKEEHKPIFLSSPVQVVIASLKLEEARALTAEIGRHFLPNKVVAFTSSRDDELSGRIPLITDKVAVQDRPTVYIRENYACKAPITDLVEYTNGSVQTFSMNCISSLVSAGVSRSEIPGSEGVMLCKVPTGSSRSSLIVASHFASSSQIFTLPLRLQ